MREKLIQYVNLLFAGGEDCGEIRQEILQNTLDRYDDLISQGKAPEAAYRLSITGIGDINELLQSVQAAPEQPRVVSAPAPTPSASVEFPKASRKPARIAIRLAALVIYLTISLSTGCWFITWLLFPIAACVQGLVMACMDLKEARKA